MYHRTSTSSSSGHSTGLSSLHGKKQKGTDTPWLSAQSMKAFYVESNTLTARNNAIAASALSKMSSSNHHLPLRDTSNLTNGTIGKDKLPAPVTVNRTPASRTSSEEDSQGTCLNTFDESAQFPISFAQVEEAVCNDVSSNQKNTPDYGIVPC